MARSSGQKLLSFDRKLGARFVDGHARQLRHRDLVARERWLREEHHDGDQLGRPELHGDERNRPDPRMDVYGADFRMIDNYLGNAAIAALHALRDPHAQLDRVSPADQRRD